MTSQTTCISADTVRGLHHGLIATRQPPRLRGMSAFARPVDPVEIIAITTTSPPLLYGR